MIRAVSAEERGEGISYGCVAHAEESDEDGCNGRAHGGGGVQQGTIFYFLVYKNKYCISFARCLISWFSGFAFFRIRSTELVEFQIISNIS